MDGERAFSLETCALALYPAPRLGEVRGVFLLPHLEGPEGERGSRFLGEALALYDRLLVLTYPSWEGAPPLPEGRRLSLFRVPHPLVAMGLAVRALGMAGGLGCEKALEEALALPRGVYLLAPSRVPGVVLPHVLEGEAWKGLPGLASRREDGPRVLAGLLSRRAEPLGRAELWLARKDRALEERVLKALDRRRFGKVYAFPLDALTARKFGEEALVAMVLPGE